jgi:hypothetical protein
MMPAPYKAFARWMDADGRIRFTGVPTFTGAQDILIEAQRLSNAAILDYTEGEWHRQTPHPPTLDSLEMVAVVTFQAASGARTSVTIPAPGDIFRADGMTVDPSKITDLRTVCALSLATVSGESAPYFVGGHRAVKPARLLDSK